MSNKRKSLSPGTLLAPIPPAMVTVGNEENSNILTIAWTGILATIPPKTYVSIRPSRHSYSILKECGEFVINLPSVGRRLRPTSELKAAISISQMSRVKLA